MLQLSEELQNVSNSIDYTLGMGGGNRHFRHFRHSVLAIFQIFGVNVEKIKGRKVQNVWVMDIRCQRKSCSQ